MPTEDSRYPNMKFPDWEFREYPKFLWNKPGPDKDSTPEAIIAQSPEHEAELNKSRPKPVEAPKAPFGAKS